MPRIDLSLFPCEALTDRLNARFDLNLTNTEGASTGATHQSDGGKTIRSASQALSHGFDRGGPDVADKPATSRTEFDASHFCTLGIEARFRGRIAPHLTKHPVAFDLHEMLGAICGNTRPRPTPISINPDTRMDALPGQLGMQMLNGKPPASTPSRARYIAEARRVMGEWRDKWAKRGQHGLAACTQADFAFHDDPEKVQNMWTAVTGKVTSDCYALGLPCDRYLRRTVR